MPTNKPDYWSKNGGANYKKYQGNKKAIKKRVEQNKARRMAGLKKGDLREANHIKPLDKGGKTTKGNIEIISRKKNRSLGAAIANKKKGKGYKKNT